MTKLIERNTTIPTKKAQTRQCGADEAASPRRSIAGSIVWQLLEVWQENSAQPVHEIGQLREQARGAVLQEAQSGKLLEGLHQSTEQTTDCRRRNAR